MRRHVCLLAALLLVAACADTGGQGEGGATTSPPPAPEPSTTDRPDAPEVEVAPAVEVGRGPVGLAATEEAVWVVSARDEVVQRVPLGSAAADLTVEVPGTPLRATAAFGALWVSSFARRKLLRVDPANGDVTATLETGEGPEGVTSGFGSVWLVVQDAGRLLRVDPATAAVTADIGIGVGARLVAAGPDAMYVAHYRDNTVLRVDPATDSVAATSKAFCEGPQGMAVVDDSVWVACTVSEEVVALDAGTLEPIARVPVAGQPDPVEVTPDGRIAVVAQDGPRLVVIDPTDGTVVAEQVLGQEIQLYDQANLDLAFAGGQAWVSSFDADRVYRVPLPG